MPNSLNIKNEQFYLEMLMGEATAEKPKDEEKKLSWML